MSDLGFTISNAGQNLFEALARPSGFRADARFGALPPPEPRSNRIEDGPEPTDPVDEAFAQGFAAGYEQALEEARVRAEAESAAREGLAFALSRLDAAQEEELRMRLRETVAALCESAIAPLAIDRDSLLRRIGVAVTMLSRADDDRIIRLHPEDVKLISERMSAEWKIEADARMERGTIRVETANGGVEDGPTTWRMAIAEALQHC
jgi:flagellar assembly protein FliH